MPLPRRISRLARLARVAALTLVLAACESPVLAPAYVPPPPSVPSARLAFRAKMDPFESYYVELDRDAQACTGHQRVGNRGTSSTPPEATRVAAGTLQTLVVTLIRPRQYCRMLWSFTPQAGRAYQLSLESRSDGCVSRIYDATQPDAAQPEPSARLRNPGNQSCLPLDKSTPLVKPVASLPRVDVNDLPISSDDSTPPPRTPAARRPAAPASAKPAVTEDDLAGLIGH